MKKIEVMNSLGLRAAVVIVCVCVLFPMLAQATIIIPPLVITSTLVVCTPFGCLVITDPQNVQSFQLDLLYNPAAVTFLSGADLAPFTGPPPTLIAPGDVRFTGSATSPPAGDVNIFSALFSGNASGQIFTTEAIGSDFVVGFDPSTGLTTTYGPSSIVLSSGSCPEPSTVLLLTSGLAGAILRSGRRRFVRRR